MRMKLPAYKAQNSPPKPQKRWILHDVNPAPCLLQGGSYFVGRQQSRSLVCKNGRLARRKPSFSAATISVEILWATGSHLEGEGGHEWAVILQREPRLGDVHDVEALVHGDLPQLVPAPASGRHTTKERICSPVCGEIKAKLLPKIPTPEFVWDGQSYAGPGSLRHGFLVCFWSAGNCCIALRVSKANMEVKGPPPSLCHFVAVSLRKGQCKLLLHRLLWGSLQLFWSVPSTEGK